MMVESSARSARLSRPRHVADPGGFAFLNLPGVWSQKETDSIPNETGIDSIRDEIRFWPGIDLTVTENGRHCDGAPLERWVRDWERSTAQN
jgi:hypothetical protein